MNPELAEDQLVRELLAPFTRVKPATLNHHRPRVRARRLLVPATAATATLGLLFGGLAVAGVFGPLHGASIQPNPPAIGGDSTLACRLIGGQAGAAQTQLTQAGYRIEWRFQHWGTQTAVTPSGAPGAVTGGYSSEPSSVPSNSIVWDIAADERSPKTVFVFVQAPNDPNAPTVTAPSCG